MVLWRGWLVAVFVVVLCLAPFPSATPGAPAARRSPTIPAIERKLANALAKATRTWLLRVHRQRDSGRRALPGYQVEWANLASGRRRLIDYNASGQPITSRSSSYPVKDLSDGWNPSGACGCDLDPFTDFPGRTLHVSQLADQTVDGRPTFHLRFTVTNGLVPSTTDFWIGRSNLLPVRSTVVYGGTLRNGQREPTMSTTDDFTWLPRTSANLAQAGG